MGHGRNAKRGNCNEEGQGCNAKKRAHLRVAPPSRRCTYWHLRCGRGPFRCAPFSVFKASVAAVAPFYSLGGRLLFVAFIGRGIGQVVFIERAPDDRAILSSRR